MRSQQGVSTGKSLSWSSTLVQSQFGRCVVFVSVAVFVLVMTLLPCARASSNYEHNRQQHLQDNDECSQGVLEGCIVKNFRSLADRVADDATRDDLLKTRRHALEIAQAGVEGVLTRTVFQRTVSIINDDTASNGGKKRLVIKPLKEGHIIHGGRASLDKEKDVDLEVVLELDEFEHVFVVGGGKAAADSAEQLELIFEKAGLIDRIDPRSLVTDVVEKPLKRIQVVKGTHPLPSPTNVAACEKMLDLVRGSTEKDLVIVLISGGGSAILSNPTGGVGDPEGESEKKALETLVKMSSGLLRSGAEIHEMNTVRKHMSKVAGGQLSVAAGKARVVSLIFSDVVGNDLSVIASGPTVLDPTTLEDVNKVLQEHAGKELPYNSVEEGNADHSNSPDPIFVETPKDYSLFAKTTNILLLDNSYAVSAMHAAAEERGYIPVVLGTELRGESRSVAEMLGSVLNGLLTEKSGHFDYRALGKGVALIGAGESSVLVKGSGKGGRNQQLALAYLLKEFEDKEWVGGSGVFLASDGIDNSEAAGAIVDAFTIEKVASTQSELEHTKHAFETCDAFHVFENSKDLIFTGPTGTNVADLMLVLVSKDSLERRYEKLKHPSKEDGGVESLLNEAAQAIL